MSAGNLVISPRFLGIEQDSIACCAKRKWIFSIPPSFARHVKWLLIAGSADSSIRGRVSILLLLLSEKYLIFW